MQKEQKAIKMCYDDPEQPLGVLIEIKARSNSLSLGLLSFTTIAF